MSKAEVLPTTPAVGEPQYAIPAAVQKTLSTILAWPRGHDGECEKLFQSWLRKQLKQLPCTVEELPFGQVAATVKLNKKRPASKVLFCCHTDTVDSPLITKTKDLVYDANFGEIFLAKDKGDHCLGADDGVGVWLLLELIRNEVPGTYLFHRCEERGGLGAKEMVEKKMDWLRQFDMAIEPDRAGTAEILTHQRHATRCASDAFGNALAIELNKKGLSLGLSTTGVYTDVFDYRGLIPECVNISVGYQHQHSPDETLNYAYLCTLRDAMVAVDWATLPVERKAEIIEPKPFVYSVPEYTRNAYPFKQYKSPVSPLASPTATKPWDQWSDQDEFDFSGDGVDYPLSLKDWVDCDNYSVIESFVENADPTELAELVAGLIAFARNRNDKVARVKQVINAL